MLQKGAFFCESLLQMVRAFVSASKQGVSTSSIPSVKLLPKETETGGVLWFKKEHCSGSNAYKNVCPAGFL